VRIRPKCNATIAWIPLYADNDETKQANVDFHLQLLPRLTYNQHMSIHCVFNGPEMVTPKQWKVARFVRKRKALRFDDMEEEWSDF